jgi:type IV pilus assembly protein PilC
MNKKLIKTHTFIWEGIDKSGMKARGELDEIDKKSATQQLRKSGTTPLKITKKPVSFFSKFKGKVSSHDIIAFSRDLSNLVSAHIPIAKALEISKHNTRKPLLKKIICDIKEQVNSGNSLAEAFKKHPTNFDDIYCSLINAGEQSGTLHIMLKNITEHQQKRNKLKHNINKALLYPAIVLFISLIVTLALLIFIVPQFVALFNSVGTDLPLLTKIIIAISNTVFNNIIAIFTNLIFVFISIKVLLKKSNKFIEFIHIISLKIPLFGSLLKQSILARSFNTLSTLLTTGIPITEALHLTARISGNSIYQKTFYDISKKVTAGHSLHQAISESNKFPHNVTQMISVGESSGTLEDMLKGIGEYFEERTNDIVYNLSQLLEPIIMIFLCLIIGTVVIAMYLPIFRIGAAL